MARSGWKTHRILIEIPIRGDVSTKDVIWALNQQIDVELPRLNKGHDVGRMRIKSYDRWKRAKDFNEALDLLKNGDSK